MTASIHILNADAAYALARRVLLSRVYDEEAVEAALDVLRHSPDADDRALVRALRGTHRRIGADMAQLDEERLDQEREAKRQLMWTLYAVAVVGGIFGGTAMEWAMTAANAGAF